MVIVDKYYDLCFISFLLEHMMNLVVNMLVDWIESCIRSKMPMKVEPIARKSGYSLRHLHNIFKAEVGTTLGKYIRLRRITQAALLIRFTNKSLLDISLDLNFGSQQALTRSFVKHFNCTPLEYRKRNFIDTSRLYPPFSNKFNAIVFEEASLNSIYICATNFNYQDAILGERIIDNNNIKKEKILHVLQNKEKAYVVSSWTCLNNLESTIEVNSFIGFEVAAKEESTLQILHKSYISSIFKGTWDEYIIFSQQLYMNSNFVRVEGYDIEVFYLDNDNCSLEGELNFTIITYMPV